MKRQMTKKKWKGMSGLAIIAFMLMCAGVLGFSAPAAAEFLMTLDPGVACDFGLQIDFYDPNIHRPYLEFFDKNGNLVRILSLGKGAHLIFTNLSSGKTYETKGDGSNSMMTNIRADGSYTYTFAGHNVIILYPTDIPAGPSTTWYRGVVKYSVDANQVWTLEKTSGPAFDICAALE